MTTLQTQVDQQAAFDVLSARKRFVEEVKEQAKTDRTVILDLELSFQPPYGVVYDGDTEPLFSKLERFQRGLRNLNRAMVDYELLGFPLLCIIRLNSPRGGQGVDALIADIPEVIEANRVTGSESHVIRARVRDTEHLEDLLHRLWAHGDSVTNIVTSSPVPSTLHTARK